MKEPILVIMAAGMGSRYGGPKQIDPVGAHGEIIIDYSIYDALKAGFKRIVCVIKHEIEKDFKEIIGSRLSQICEVHYAYQNIDDLPAGYTVPPKRMKPWGTGHAILSARKWIDAPFAVINADDFYGAQAFKLIYNYLCTANDEQKYHYAMVGYVLENTLTENGYVARGVCSVENGYLKDIHERTHIEKRNGQAEYTEDEGKSWIPLERGSIVSMNLWGFTPSMMQELEAEFPAFLDEALVQNPQKAEYFLPTVVSTLLKKEKASVEVFCSPDRWYGVTYKEDKPAVQKAIAEMTEKGLYPKCLWEE